MPILTAIVRWTEQPTPAGYHWLEEGTVAGMTGRLAIMEVPLCGPRLVRRGKWTTCRYLGLVVADPADAATILIAEPFQTRWQAIGWVEDADTRELAGAMLEAWAKLQAIIRAMRGGLPNAPARAGAHIAARRVPAAG